MHRQCAAAEKFRARRDRQGITAAAVARREGDVFRRCIADHRIGGRDVNAGEFSAAHAGDIERAASCGLYRCAGDGHAKAISARTVASRAVYIDQTRGVAVGNGRRGADFNAQVSGGRAAAETFPADIDCATAGSNRRCADNAHACIVTRAGATGAGDLNIAGGGTDAVDAVDLHTVIGRPGRAAAAVTGD